MKNNNLLAECDAIIETLKIHGQVIPEWLLDQRKTFLGDAPVNSVYEELKNAASSHILTNWSSVSQTPLTIF